VAARLADPLAPELLERLKQAADLASREAAIARERQAAPLPPPPPSVDPRATPELEERERAISTRLAGVAQRELELARRAAAIGRDVSDLRSTGLVGTPSEVVDKIGAYAEAGATTVYLQILDLADLDHLDLLASQVLPQV